MKINIGCGKDYRKGWVNTDYSAVACPDIVHDIRFEHLPFQDSSIEEIFCSGVLEQILDNEDLRFAINEMWRVLVWNGKLQVIVPNAEYPIAFQDPFDVRKFVPKTFDYLVGDRREHQLYGSVYGFKPWKSYSLSEGDQHILTVNLVK